MRVGEPERSWRRDYDDGSAGNAAKYDDARADNDDYTAATTTAAATTTITNCPTSQTTILMASVVLKTLNAPWHTLRPPAVAVISISCRSPTAHDRR